MGHKVLLSCVGSTKTQHVCAVQKDLSFVKLLRRKMVSFKLLEAQSGKIIPNFHKKKEGQKEKSPKNENKFV